jgi:hypothetical protein
VRKRKKKGQTSGSKAKVETKWQLLIRKGSEEGLLADLLPLARQGIETS